MNKVDADYIGLLVLDVFNAAIGRQNIRSEYTFRSAVRLCAAAFDSGPQQSLQQKCSAHALAPQCCFAYTLLTRWRLLCLT